MLYVLVVVSVMAGGYPTVSMQEFQTAGACDAASEILRNMVRQTSAGRVSAVCVPKG